MEDLLLMQFLKKKGVISERDIHEFHELASTSMNEEPIYLSSTRELNTDTSINETKAKRIVSNMYHIEGGRKYIGEKFDIYKAKEIYNRYKGMIPSYVTTCDLYIAINAQYHDYIKLFKAWFNDNIETKIVESAINYWFKDDDYTGENKLYKYFMEA